MASKVVALILVAGIAAAGLLAIRQARIATAHDMARLHRQLVFQRQDVQALHVMLQEQLETTQLRETIAEFEVSSGVRLVPLRLEECILRCVPGVNVTFAYTSQRPS